MSDLEPVPNLPLRPVPDSSGHLNCPECASAMQSWICEHVLIDKCENCGGLWFDEKELGVFIDALGRMALDQLANLGDGAQIQHGHRINSCPRCTDPLIETEYSYKSGVTLERCVKCKGIWLSAAEAAKLAELARLSREIKNDVRELARELKERDEENRRWREYKETGDKLREHHYWTPWGVQAGVIAPVKIDTVAGWRAPVTTLALIAINVFVYLTAAVHAPLTFGMRPAEVLHGRALSTLVTSMFLHAGVLHLLGNMFALWLFGVNLEERLGRLRFLVFYLTCGLAANLIQALSAPGSATPVVGASGAVAGLMGAYLISFPRVNMKVLFGGVLVDLPASVWLIFWLSLQFIGAAIFPGTGFSDVAYWAHLGGFLVGALLAPRPRAPRT